MVQLPRRVALLAMSVLAAVSAAAPAGADHSFGVHWRTPPDNLGHIRVVDFSVGFINYTTSNIWPILPAVTEWNVGAISAPRAVFYSANDASLCQMNCVPIYEVNDPNGPHGVVTVNASGGHWTNPSITLNIAKADPVVYTQRLSTVCQEIGHVLGLDHVSNLETCMNPDFDFPGPSADDYLQLQRIYNHTD